MLPHTAQVYPERTRDNARRLTPTGITILSAAESYRLSLRAGGKSPGTEKIYLSVIAEFAAYLADTGMPDDPGLIRREHVESYLVHLQERLAPASAALVYRSLKTFWRWLVDEDEIDASPMEKMKPPRVPQTPPPVVGEEAMRRLLKTCEGTDFEARRDNALIRLLASTGMRRGECVALRLEDVDLARGTVVIRAGTSKGRRQRTARFGHKTAKALDRYLRRRGAHKDAALPHMWLGRVGPLQANGLLQAIRRRGKQAGIGRVYTHQLRHTFAHQQLASGEQEGNVMQIGGWQSRDMLDRYGAIAKAERAQASYKDPWDEL